ncbi:hypothetical protein [Vitiosangium sp. GDMCC 1.1324]|uniref:hypothetical protein n=1 Tax=Vitiosangium sp. (strain GDMCC 1.1324) TaxID=2138576 RepID=UPI000D395727|nr:hypothetical protein [Vitiosangium sp. GDMCC 1.1324]PTL82054.1 hypothetical protein DAT35_19810 [Vitiosangium sp. GDMCC 1.1324]
MSRWPLWAVLAPGEPARLESRAQAIVMPDWDEEDGEELPFEVIPGSGRYHAIVGTDPSDVGAEMQLAEELSLECDEPVYSIERANDPWSVMSWRNGALEVLEVDPESLAESLGCPLPGREKSSDSPAKKPLRKAALVEGVRAEEAHRVLEEVGDPFPPGHYLLEDTPRGLLIAGGTGDIGYADITVSERIPHATVYAVIASPDLDEFFVTVRRGGEGVEEFAQPPDEFPRLPVVSEIKGERSPERILAALGIPAEWFRNE